MILVAFLLLPLLIDTAKVHLINPRPVIASSEMHYMGFIGSDVAVLPPVHLS
jgi:hypothetical protein